MDEQDQALATTVEALYRTLTDESAWSDLLRSLSVAFDSPRVSIMRASAAVDEPYEMRAWNFDEETQRLYDQYYWSKDPIVPVTRDMALGVWTNVDSLLDPKATTSPEYVSDFALKRGLRYVSGAKLYAGNDSVVILGVQRPSDHRPFGEDSLQTYSKLFPHLARLATLSEELRRARLTQGVSQAALDGIEWPIFVVSKSGGLLLANRAGTQQIARRTPFREQNGRLVCTDPDLQLRLEWGLQLAAATKATAFRAKIRAETWLVRLVPTSAHGGCALIYAAPLYSAPAPTDLLRQLLDFSQAEAEIAYLLADGYSPKEIAFERHVSVTTVRTQIRAILDKACVRRQTDLAKILSSLPRVTTP